MSCWSEPTLGGVDPHGSMAVKRRVIIEYADEHRINGCMFAAVRAALVCSLPVVSLALKNVRKRSLHCDKNRGNIFRGLSSSMMSTSSRNGSQQSGPRRFCKKSSRFVCLRMTAENNRVAAGNPRLSCHMCEWIHSREKLVTHAGYERAAITMYESKPVLSLLQNHDAMVAVRMPQNAHIPKQEHKEVAKQQVNKAMRAGGRCQKAAEMHRNRATRP